MQIKKNIKGAFSSVIAKTKSPVQSNFLTIKGLFYSVIVALVVFAAFFVLEPFSIKSYVSGNKMLLIALTALAAFLGMLIANFGLPILFKKYFTKESWTVSKEVTLFVLRFFFVGLIVMVVGNQTGLTKFDLPMILLKFTALGVVIGYIASLIKEKILRKRYQGRVLAINERLQNFIPSEDKSVAFPVIILSGSNDKISVVPNQLISVKSGKNLTEVSYQNLFGVVNKSLIIRKEEIIAEMSKYPQFIQLSDGLFVNAHALYKTAADGSGYEAYIAKLSEPLKVSQTFQATLEGI